MKKILFFFQDIKRIDVNGSWISGVCAGGSRNNVELFATNPQYEFGIHTTNCKYIVSYLIAKWLIMIVEYVLRILGRIPPITATIGTKFKFV